MYSVLSRTSQRGPITAPESRASVNIISLHVTTLLTSQLTWCSLKALSWFNECKLVCIMCPNCWCCIEEGLLCHIQQKTTAGMPGIPKLCGVPLLLPHFSFELGGLLRFLDLSQDIRPRKFKHPVFKRSGPRLKEYGCWNLESSVPGYSGRALSGA